MAAFEGEMVASDTRYKTILTVALSLLGACLLCGLALPVLAAGFADDLARGLLPPAYPGSELLRVSGRQLWQHARYEDRVYYSPDAPDDVLLFLERHMPGFGPVRDVSRRICYSNTREVRGMPLSIRAGPLANVTWPSAHVIVCAARAGGTEIITSAMWPEP